MVNGNICDFEGQFVIKYIKSIKGPFYSLDANKPDTIIRGFIIGEYKLKETKTQYGSGIFIGKFVSKWYLDKKGSIAYDSLEANYSDGFWNNWFIGTWTSYQNTLKKRCNWGDGRIPFSDDLDVGTAEFYPNKKYLNNGWRSFHQAYSLGDSIARKYEKKPWW